MKKIIAQGAEAILIKDGDILTKNRIKKAYRHPYLDLNLRKKRTRYEARIIEKVFKLIPVPKIFKTSEFEIEMSFIEGKKLSEYLDYAIEKEQKEICKQIGKNISKLHENGIIHGDLTTSNMIWQEKSPDRKKNNQKKLYFIDFGLSFHSQRDEDKAVDLHLLKEALQSKHFKRWQFFFREIIKNYSNKKILKTIEKVELRGRYRKKGTKDN